MFMKLCFMLNDQIKFVWWSNNNTLTVWCNAVSVLPLRNVKWWKQGGKYVNIQSIKQSIDRAVLDFKQFHWKKMAKELDHENSPFRICTLLSITPIILKAKGRSKFVPPCISSSCVDEIPNTTPNEAQFKGKEQYPASEIVWTFVLYKKNLRNFCVPNVIGACIENHAFNFLDPQLCQKSNECQLCPPACRSVKPFSDNWFITFAWILYEVKIQWTLKSDEPFFVENSYYAQNGENRTRNWHIELFSGFIL